MEIDIVDMCLDDGRVARRKFWPDGDFILRDTKNRTGTSKLMFDLLVKNEIIIPGELSFQDKRADDWEVI